MDWHVCEPYEPYSFLEQMPPHPAFTFREELTLEERVAVAGYQDMGFLQHTWEVVPPDVNHPMPRGTLVTQGVSTAERRAIVR